MLVATHGMGNLTPTIKLPTAAFALSRLPSGLWRNRFAMSTRLPSAIAELVRQYWILSPHMLLTSDDYDDYDSHYKYMNIDGRNRGACLHHSFRASTIITCHRGASLRTCTDNQWATAACAIHSFRSSAKTRCHAAASFRTFR